MRQKGVREIQSVRGIQSALAGSEDGERGSGAGNVCGWFLKLRRIPSPSEQRNRDFIPHQIRLGDLGPLTYSELCVFLLEVGNSLFSRGRG